jgi:hypothetical protein
MVMKSQRAPALQLVGASVSTIRSMTPASTD